MDNCCHPRKKKDYLFWSCLLVIALAYFCSFFLTKLTAPEYLATFIQSVFSQVNSMWWGVLLGMFFVGLLDKVPREFVMSLLGRKRGLQGILRAVGAGTIFDLCSHGILLVAMKLYERGASLGQVMAFLIASPWNSFSLTLILWSLIGFKWTLIFLLLSLVIALISGLIFEKLVEKKILPDNPNHTDFPKDFKFFEQAKKQMKGVRFNGVFFRGVVISGVVQSKMILRWLLLGIILAALIRSFMPIDMFHALFGPTVSGLFLTIAAATVIEVCSEGATPIAADLFNRALAPGNSFAFLMAGVATDYTEIMALRETTKSWKISLFLPLVTLPQVVLLGYIINHWSTVVPS